VDGRIHLGGFSMAVPDGWSVVGKPAVDGCIPAKTVTLGWSPVHDGRCRLDRIISVSGEGGPRPVGGLVTIAGNPVPAIAQFTLPGGQPAYTGMGGHDSPDPFGARPDPRTVSLDIPWSNAFVELNLGHDDLTRAIASIRTTPMPPGVLTLHTEAAAGYFVPATEEASTNVVDVNEARAMQVLARLRALTEVVPPGQECGTVDDPAAAIYLFPRHGFPSNDLVVITESDTCAQATSLLGGRVTVPRGLVDELRTMVSAP